MPHYVHDLLGLNAEPFAGAAEPSMRFLYFTLLAAHSGTLTSSLRLVPASR